LSLRLLSTSSIKKQQMSEARVLSAQALRKTWQFRFLIQVRVCALALETLVVGCDQRPDLICLSALPDRCDPLPRFGHHVAPIGLLLGPVVFSVGLVLVGIPKNELKEMDIAFERGLWGSLIGSVPIAGLGSLQLTTAVAHLAQEASGNRRDRIGWPRLAFSCPWEL
jgi:hypothetical protein